MSTPSRKPTIQGLPYPPPHPIIGGIYDMIANYEILHDYVASSADEIGPNWSR